ncbi:MAG TPA: glutamate--cysteine ligase, partial [Pseudonocardiaceae bacterium]|nr:glutamate--cysteine ligase [Pseudonocardiaceae bacterium]
MGEGLVDAVYTTRDLQRYRTKTQRCLEALAQMLSGDSFAAGPECMGLELELNLVDQNVDPAMANQTVLKHIDDPAFQTELGQHNIEINVPPRPLADDEALGLERELRAGLNTANDAARAAGVGLVMIGILPTLRPDHFDRRWMSPNSRYALLNRQILASRSEDLQLDMEGVPLAGGKPERLLCAADSVLPESGCTSAQLHLQIGPEQFAAHWNAAQALAGVQVGLGANSPFLL